jgi:peptide-methionine (S)-S-oxide reductase
MNMRPAISVLLFMMLVFGLVFRATKTTQARHIDKSSNMTTTQVNDTATFAGGCFWCIDAIYREIKGVVEVKSGYTGGKTVNPTYSEVCTGQTGHAEAVQIVYDPKKVSYAQLLEVFFTVHNPTTLNQQGADVGTQYRSAIFYHNQAQKELAELVIKRLTAEGTYPNPIVTEVVPFKVFYVAEGYHQDYFENNRRQPYCQMVIQPKKEKFEKAFKDLLKK